MDCVQLNKVYIIIYIYALLRYGCIYFTNSTLQIQWHFNINWTCDNFIIDLRQDNEEYVEQINKKFDQLSELIIKRKEQLLLQTKHNFEMKIQTLEKQKLTMDITYKKLKNVKLFAINFSLFAKHCKYTNIDGCCFN